MEDSDRVSAASGYSHAANVMEAVAIGIEHFVPATCPTATSARPGSPAKVAVLVDRAAQGFELWHPLDARDGRQIADGREHLE
jgi:hypothetical protein